MGVGSFLSEETSEQLYAKKNLSRRLVAKAAVIMFISYFIAGFIPLVPYIFPDGKYAETYSILLTLLFLVFLGIYSARRFHGNVVSKSVEMLILGGLATLVGIGVGSVLKV